ncbi:cytochrome P450 736A117-like [Aristolochia californica]|uniref:cytochrome P450 736A117-like n=1 Tax=Aristolochia californica TaxID=171875 RepID=UPI0035DD59E9
MLLTLTITSLFLTLFVYFALKPNSRKSKYPPSPPKLPFIGNLHQLGSIPHRSLGALSKKHGPLMLLHIGNSPALVVSSKESAEEIMKTQDLIFADRPPSLVFDAIGYRGKDVALARYGEHWRQVKKITVQHLLNIKLVESFRVVREDEVASLVEKISRASGPVNLSELVISTTSNIISTIALGRKYYDEKQSEGNGFNEFLEEFFLLLGAFHIGDYIPSLGWIGCLTGLDARLKKHSQQWNNFLDQVIAEHIGTGKDVDNGRKDFVDMLLEVEEGGSVGVPFNKDHIKAVLLDTFAAGTDSTYTAINWTLAELVRNPREMKKVQEEIRRTVRGNSRVTEDDLRQMSYLKCVIKESFRMHPPFPLLLPRNCMQNAEVMGYQVPANSRVVVNAWAIGRDPEAWDNPEEFRPERFINSGVDFRGHDFGLIPFGSGRRACPGISFAVAKMELVLASVLHGFDWEVPGGASPEALDMTEVQGATTRKKIPLILVARPYIYSP